MNESNLDLLKQLEQEEASDDKLMAQIQSRKLDRQRKWHAVLESGTTRGSSLKLSCVDFDVMLQYFKYEANKVNYKALVCPACGGIPEDVRLARCSHLYCEECYSNMLMTAGAEVQGEDAFLLCEEEDCSEDILDNIILDSNQFRRLLEAMEYNIDDVDLLLRLSSGSPAQNTFFDDPPKLDDNHKKRQITPDTSKSMALSGGSPILGESLDDDEDVLAEDLQLHEDFGTADDGYDVGSERSSGYESDTDMGEIDTNDVNSNADGEGSQWEVAEDAITQAELDEIQYMPILPHHRGSDQGGSDVSSSDLEGGEEDEDGREIVWLHD